VSATISAPQGAAFLQEVPYQSVPYQFYLGTGELGERSRWRSRAR
jgi:hypothetical protein